ncbi:hypothetical protein SAMN05216420_101257 [Nitrosospira sp. Nl5]|nr:hypothetical protein SAMN05216420_101257 [Nitrosospira sp. Nl5]
MTLPPKYTRSKVIEEITKAYCARSVARDNRQSELVHLKTWLLGKDVEAGRKPQFAISLL